MRDEVADGWKISQVEALVGLPRRDIQRACYEGAGGLGIVKPRNTTWVGACMRFPMWRSSSCWRRGAGRARRLMRFATNSRLAKERATCRTSLRDASRQPARHAMSKQVQAGLAALSWTEKRGRKVA